MAIYPMKGIDTINRSGDWHQNQNQNQNQNQLYFLRFYKQEISFCEIGA